MNRPSTFEDRLQAWLDEGPTSGPDDLLVSAHARARSTRQRPSWWVALKGDTMTTTWRARPALIPGRLAFILLTALLVLALAATTLLVGSRLTARVDGGEGGDARLVAAPIIPTGDEALFAFTSWSSSETAGDLFVVRADGTEGRQITGDALDDWSPSWSPDGSRIAFYSGDMDATVKLRVASSAGIADVAVTSGCWNPTSQAPAWSPDGRFILYVADRLPDDGLCDDLFTDIYVVPADGSAPGRRLLAETATEFSGFPAWHGDRIVFRANSESEGGLWVAEVTDPAAPWGLTARRLDDTSGADPVAFAWPRWSPDGSTIATSSAVAGVPYSTPLLIPEGGGDPLSLWPDRSVDAIVPDWSPDGDFLTLLVMRRELSDYAIYQLYIVGADGSDPRLIDTPDLTGNAGPAMISPDGSRAIVRAPRGAMPGDLLVVSLDDEDDTTLLFAGQWSSVDWQPVVNADNPAASAPEGLPAA